MKRKVITLFPLLVPLFLLPLFSFSQNGLDYRIDLAGDYDQSVLESALDNANLDSYRRLETDRRLIFDNGAEVTLFPAKHLEANGLAVNSSLAIPEEFVIDPNRIFILHPSGILMESIAPAPGVK